MNKFKGLFAFLVLCAMFIFTACNLGENAISVSIYNITGSGSKDYTFSVSYQEEDFYKDKGCDIYIKSDVENLKIKIKKEYQDFVTIVLKDKNEFYSLTKLISDANSENVKFLKYQNMLNSIYIINSESDATLEIKAVVGDITEVKSMLYNTFDVSKTLKIDIEKYEK